MEGRIRITLEREPDSFLAAAIEGDIHQVIVARDEASGRLMGMGSRSELDAYLNGRRARLGYLSQLRTDRRLRGRPRSLKAGYAKLRELHNDGAAPFYVTTIIKDNLPARRILEAGIEGLPVYRPLESFVTLVLPVARRCRNPPPPDITVDRGGAADLGEIADCLQRCSQRYQFAPCWSRETLTSSERTRDLRLEDFYLARRDRRVVGCLARWDQRGFKQSVVQGYARSLGLLSPVINLARPWLAAPRLPRPGEQLRSAFVSHVAVDDDDPDLLVALLAAAYNDAVGGPLDCLLLGFARRNPLLRAVEASFQHRQYVSILYVVHWEDGAAAVDALDGRIPHLEAAIL